MAKLTDWAIALLICWGGFLLFMAAFGGTVYAVARFGGLWMIPAGMFAVCFFILLAPASDIVARRRRARGASDAR